MRPLNVRVCAYGEKAITIHSLVKWEEKKKELLCLMKKGLLFLFYGLCLIFIALLLL